jgi:hypothetical protein
MVFVELTDGLVVGFPADRYRILRGRRTMSPRKMPWN